MCRAPGTQREGAAWFLDMRVRKLRPARPGPVLGQRHPLAALADTSLGVWTPGEGQPGSAWGMACCEQRDHLWPLAGHRGVSRDSDALDPNAEIGDREAQANGRLGEGVPSGSQTLVLFL